MEELFKLYDRSGCIETIDTDTAVTVGVFDGVHRGHQALFHQLSTLSPFTSHLSPLAVTLTAHPSFVLGRRDSEYWLDDKDEHLHLLFEAGARYVAVLPFSREVAQLTACQMARLLYVKLRMRALLIGYDSRFGSKQNDDFENLPLLAKELGFTISKGDPFTIGDGPISSSRIRESLTSGNVEETANLLGRHYSVTGTVEHGRGVGHTLGFPTANIDLSQTRKMLPAHGVYVVSVGSLFGMANLGDAPTFGVDKPTLEVHLLDYCGDLYNQTVTVEFLHRLRDIEHFDTAEALRTQLNKDIEQARLWS